MKKFTLLSGDEIQFLYCMVVTYGEMPEFDDSVPPPPPKNNRNNRNNKNGNKNRNNNYKKKKRPFKKRDMTKPDLYDFNDPLWEKCKDEKFLAYKIIVEKTY